MIISIHPGVISGQGDHLFRLNRIISTRCSDYFALKNLTASKPEESVINC